MPDTDIAVNLGDREVELLQEIAAHHKIGLAAAATAVLSWYLTERLYSMDPAEMTELDVVVERAKARFGDEPDPRRARLVAVDRPSP